MRLLLCLCVLLVPAGAAWGDVFEHYTNRVLDRLTQGKDVTEIKQLTPNLIVDHDRVLPKESSAFLVVRTNAGRLAKLLVQAGKQKVSDTKTLHILSIERFVTYKEGEDRQVVASGTNQSLYAGFRFSLDLGQVVPEDVGGDIRFVVDGDKVFAEPLGKAKLFLVTRHDPAIVPKKAGKLVVGEKFDPKYFAGTFKLYDDGRRSGRLTLKVDDDGDVTGAYYSDKDGAKYEVKGKVGDPKHTIEFTVQLPRTLQAFRGMLFTGDGKAMAGSSRLAGRESAWYAVREE